MLRISHLSIKDQIPMSRIVSKYENRLNLFVRGSVVVGEGDYITVQSGAGYIGQNNLKIK